MLKELVKEFKKVDNDTKDFFFAMVFFFCFCVGFYTWCYFLIMFGGSK